MDLVWATLLGFAFGGLIALLIGLEQGRREISTFAKRGGSSRSCGHLDFLRASATRAYRLDFSRSWRALLLGFLSFESPSVVWEPFLATLAEVQVALRIVESDLTAAKIERFRRATEALFEAKSSKKALLNEYAPAAQELRHEVEDHAVGLADPKRS